MRKTRLPLILAAILIAAPICGGQKYSIRKPPPYWPIG